MHGPWDPAQGHRFNPAKLLLDPYAKAIDGDVDWDQALFALPLSTTRPARDDRDSAAYMPQASWSTRSSTGATTGRPRTPLDETVIYEAHVKGFTKRHPDVARGAARHLRGPRRTRR